MTEDDFVKKLVALNRNSSQGLIDIGAIYLTAKNTLDEESYKRFLAAFKYAGENSTVRKWIIIGKKFQKLSAYVDKLPPKWTVIYKLSSLSDDDFDLLVKGSHLNSSMEIVDIDSALHASKNVPKRNITITLSAQTYDEAELISLYEELSQNLSKSWLIKVSKPLKEILERQEELKVSDNETVI